MTAKVKNNPKDIDNIWEFLFYVASKPKILIPLGMIILVIMAFATVKVTYVNGKFIWEKVSMSRIASDIIPKTIDGDDK